MKIAIAQCQSIGGDVTANLDRIADYARRAADGDAQILVCPEMMLTGYNIGTQKFNTLAETVDGPSAGQIQTIAERERIHIVYGYPERAGGKIYNAALLVRHDGDRVLNYRKSHLYGEIERRVFTPGNGPGATIDIDGWCVSLLICYDIEFPEAVRAIALGGADLIIAPTALMHPYEPVTEFLVRARSFENQIYLAYANYCGSEGDLNYCGSSLVAAPDGSIAGQAGNDPSLFFASLDKRTLQHSRALNTYLADRRPELYGALTCGTDG